MKYATEVILALIGVIAVFAVINTWIAMDDAEEHQDHIEQAQYEACERVIAPGRAEIRQELRLILEPLVQLFRAIATGLENTATPTPDLLRRYALRYEARLGTLRERLPNVDCGRSFPPPG